MLSLLLIAFALVTAVLAVRGRARARAADIPANLLGFAVGLTVCWLARECAAISGWQAGALALRIVSALGTAWMWTRITWLGAFGLTRRGVIARSVFAGFALMLGLAHAPFGVTAAFTMCAVWSFRWRTAMGTVSLFRTLLGALALFAMLFIDLAPTVDLNTLPALDRTLTRFSQWGAAVGIGVLILGIFRCTSTFAKDPSLGIRTVARRLALSHFLVVLIPLLIVVGLWSMTTYLGVGADRASFAARVFDAETEQVQVAVRAAIETDDDSALPRYARLRAATWPGVRAYRIRGGTLSRVFGEAALGESALVQWPTLPDSFVTRGVVEIAGDRYLGVLATHQGDAGMLLAPIRSVFDSTLVPAVGAPLHIRTHVDANEADVDSIAAVTENRADSLEALARTREDSLEVARIRKVLRGVGISESTVTTTSPRNKPHVSISAGDERIDVENDGTKDDQSGFRGRARLLGITWSPSGAAPDDFGFSAAVPFRATLFALFTNVKDNPLNFIPLVMLFGMVLLVLPVAMFNFTLVRNMGGGVASAVRALRGGTTALGKGDLSYRIEVKGEDELWDASRAFNQMAEGLERARELEQERARLESELGVARRIQARLLPAKPPTVAGLEIAGLSESAREVGGDYYDHIALGEDRVLLVIADVSGKGVPAALLMSAFRASLMSQDTDHSSPAEVASRLNEFLHRSVEPGKFVTAFVGFLEGRTGRFVYANAGHNPPVLLRANGELEWLSTGGLILGIMAGSPFESGEVTLGVDDLLALYTDGVTEGADATGELWGEDRLVASLQRLAPLPCHDIAHAVVREVRDYEGDSGPADDITVLLARRLG